jgi:RNA-directed DNA polymerase
VRKKSLKRIKDAIRSKTGRTRSGSLKEIVSDLNPTLRGWFEYFKHAQRNTLNELDGFIRRRLRALLRVREKRPGAGRCLEDHKRWNNAFFAGAGLFALYPARLAAGHPR